MTPDPLTGGIAKSAIGASIKPTIAFLRAQIARRGAPFADLGTIATSDAEFDEAIAVLKGSSASLPSTVLAKLKGFISDRPASYADAEAKAFIDDDRVSALVKSGARQILRGRDIPDERARSRELHGELFGGDGIYGERLIEDAIAFAAMTVAAHLTPGDRQTIELINDFSADMRGGFAEMAARFDRFEVQATSTGGAPIDPEPFDRLVRTEIERFRRRRMLPLPQLTDEAVAFGTKVETVYRFAAPALKGEAFREVATLLIRSGRLPEGKEWLAKAEAQGADVNCEHARIHQAEGRFEDALRLLRERNDALSRGLLLDAIAHRDGEPAALTYLAERLKPEDLSGHAVLVANARMLRAGQRDNAGALLDGASDAQIAENPAILWARARQRMARAAAPDVGERLIEYEALIPRPDELHHDAEGCQQLAMAQADLERLIPQLKDLDAPEFADLVEMNLAALKLGACDPAARELGRGEFVARIQDPAQTARLAPLAQLYGITVDWAPLKAKLAEAEALGGYDDTQLRAAFAILLDEGDGQAIAEFVSRYRERLDLFSAQGRVVGVEIQALAQSGRMDKARALLAAERAALGDDHASFLDRRLDQIGGADTSDAWIAQYEASGSSTDLEVLVDALRAKEDPRLGSYAAKLWRARRQVHDAQLACEAFLSAGEEHEAEAFLDELGENARQDGLLRTHLAWARYRQGRLAEAGAELAGLFAMQVNNANTRRLTVLVAIDSGRWSDLERFVQEELAAGAARSADELLSAASLARTIGSTAIMDLLRAATDKDPDDGRIALQAYSITAEAGLDREPEASRWLAVAIQDQGRSGLIRSTNLGEAIEMMASARAQADRVGGMINTAAVPLFMGIEMVGGTQSALVIQQMEANAEESDPRWRTVVPLFAGNRLLHSLYRPASIALDPMAILVLDRLSLLETALGAFDEVVLPSGTLHSFFTDLGKAGHSQPSRVEEARRVKDAVVRGLLAVCDEVPSSGPSAVDPEFAALFAGASASDGCVVATAPLHQPGELDKIVDPAPYAGRLVSPRGLLSALQAAGAVSRVRAKTAEAAVVSSGELFPDEPRIASGKPLFLSTTAVHCLSEAGLLADLKAFAGVLYTSADAVRLAEREIAGAAAGAEVRAGIERIRAVLARAIASGSVRVGPARHINDLEAGGDPRMDQAVRRSPVVSVLRDAAGIDAFVCDDRGMNKYGQTTDRTGNAVVFLTTADLLAILRERDIIDDDRLDIARERLRRMGAAMMPVDPEEMRRASIDSDWSSGPSAELRAIRDSIHLPLARKVLQLPEERPWLRAVSLSIAYAIRHAWVEIVDDDDAERAAVYLFDMLPDVAALSADDPSADRDAWVSEVIRFVGFAVAAMFDLPSTRIARHGQWFDGHVKPYLEDRDLGAIEAVARTLYASMTEPFPTGEDDA